MVNKCATPGCDTGYKRSKKNEDPGPSEEEHVSCFRVVGSMFDFHRSDRGSNPCRGGKIS